jgi:voltage-gated potassium channel
VDAESILILMTAKKLNPEIDIILELLNKTSEIHAMESGADQIIVRGSMSSSAIVKLIKNPGSWDFLSQLFSTNMNILEQSNNELSGNNFGDPYKNIEANNRKIISVKRGEKYILRPSENEIYNGEPLILIENSVYYEKLNKHCMISVEIGQRLSRLVKGARLRVWFRRDTRVQIPPSAFYKPV